MPRVHHNRSESQDIREQASDNSQTSTAAEAANLHHKHRPNQVSGPGFFPKTAIPSHQLPHTKRRSKP
uniref:Uncharacterized protein n=1 Tax=Arundo donax TaxID=35708 RepID=A0A0A8YH11_ARUDO